MEEANLVMPEAVINDNLSANNAWKKCTSEMVNIIANKRLAGNKDYNYTLENRNLRTHYKMAITALESIITESEVTDNYFKDANNIKEDNVSSNKEVNEKNSSGSQNLNVRDNMLYWKKSAETTSSCEEQFKGKSKELPSFKNKSQINHQGTRHNSNVKMLQKKFNEHSNSLKEEESKDDLQSRFKKERKTWKVDIQSSEDFRPAKEQSDNDKEIERNNVQILLNDSYKLKRELELAREQNITLKKELISKIEENEQLRDQVQSLELSWKTLSEAINLQDEQLSEYGSVVTTLKNSRVQILEKMKDANARNAHNIRIMENIEKQVEQLRSQLDAYSELLSNQDNELIDKASSTDQTFVDQNSIEELVKKKDYYITLLQDRLCEAIVDLKNKDSEIKNHTTSVKCLIQNYEGEKKCLEERLKHSSLSVEKLEEHKIKQHETMKQLMKLVEFLQDKLEVNKKV